MLEVWKIREKFLSANISKILKNCRVFLFEKINKYGDVVGRAMYLGTPLSKGKKIFWT